MHIQAGPQSHYQHFLWRECCQTIFRSSAGGKTTRGTKRELHSYSQKGFILFPSHKWILFFFFFKSPGTDMHEENIRQREFFCFVSGINGLLVSTGQKFTSPLGRIFCSSSLKAVPILRLTVGGSSPGSRGYSFGSFPVNSYKEDILGLKEGTDKHHLLLLSLKRASFLVPPLWCRCSWVLLFFVWVFPPVLPVWPSVLLACLS